MSELIATESYAKYVGGGSGTAVQNKCCTKSRAVAFGCTVSGTYNNNQLVPKSALSGQTPPTPSQKTLLKFYIIQDDSSGKGTLYVNTDAVQNWSKCSVISLVGNNTIGQGGTVWTKDITSLYATSPNLFQPFDWGVERQWTAFIDGESVSVSLRSGYKLPNLSDFRSSAEYDAGGQYTAINCSASIDSDYTSSYASAIGWAAT